MPSLSQACSDPRQCGMGGRDGNSSQRARVTAFGVPLTAFGVPPPPQRLGPVPPPPPPSSNFAIWRYVSLPHRSSCQSRLTRPLSVSLPPREVPDQRIGNKAHPTSGFVAPGVYRVVSILAPQSILPGPAWQWHLEPIRLASQYSGAALLSTRSTQVGNWQILAFDVDVQGRRVVALYTIKTAMGQILH